MARDCFSIMFPLPPGALDTFAEQAIPESQRRGLLRRAYVSAASRRRIAYRSAVFSLLLSSTPCGLRVFLAISLRDAFRWARSNSTGEDVRTRARGMAWQNSCERRNGVVPVLPELWQFVAVRGRPPLPRCASL